jgi:hypothetical protein
MPAYLLESLFPIKNINSFEPQIKTSKCNQIVNQA